jgi:hypothetical protein
MSHQRFLLLPKQGPQPISKQLSADQVKNLMGTQNVMFIHLPNNELMLGVDYDGNIQCVEENRNDAATAIYKQHIKDGIVYGKCVLVPKTDFAPAE